MARWRSVPGPGSSASPPLAPETLTSSHQSRAAAAGHSTASSTQLDAAEKIFWDLVISKHERLRHLGAIINRSSPVRARQLARVHCVSLFADLVFLGASEGMVGFHRTPRLHTFLVELHEHLSGQRSRGVTAVEQIIARGRPDFLHYLGHVAGGVREEEYILLDEDGGTKAVQLKGVLCKTCSGQPLDAEAFTVDVGALQIDSTLQELYLKLTELLINVEAMDLVLKFRFQDQNGGQPVEILISGQWINSVFEWSCIPATQGIDVQPTYFSPASTESQLADLGLLLPGTSITVCSRMCPESSMALLASGAASAVPCPQTNISTTAAFNATAATTTTTTTVTRARQTSRSTKRTSRATRGGRGAAEGAEETFEGPPSSSVASSQSHLPPPHGRGMVSRPAVSTNAMSLLPTATTQSAAEAAPPPAPRSSSSGGNSKSKPTKRYTCSVGNCTQSATFKPADQPRSKHNMVCVNHASKGMVCIKGPLCDHPDCVHEGVSTVPRRATFGFPGHKQRRCGKHKLDGMLYATELVKKRGSGVAPGDAGSSGTSETGRTTLHVAKRPRLTRNAQQRHRQQQEQLEDDSNDEQQHPPRHQVKEEHTHARQKQQHHHRTHAHGFRLDSDVSPLTTAPDLSMTGTDGDSVDQTELSHDASAFRGGCHEMASPAAAAAAAVHSLGTAFHAPDALSCQATRIEMPPPLEVPMHGSIHHHQAHSADSQPMRFDLLVEAATAVKDGRRPLETADLYFGPLSDFSAGMLGSRSPVTSQWDGDLALVVLRVPPEGPHVAGITAADEGIYYVSMAAEDHQAGVVRRMLVRNADQLVAVPGLHPERLSLVPNLVRDVESALDRGQPRIVLDDTWRPLSLGRHAYESDCKLGLHRRPRCLSLSWWPSQERVEMAFDDRPSFECSETQASAVMTPVSSRGNWLERFVGEHAARGETLCCGDHLALLQAALRCRRDSAVNNGVPNAERIYDPHTCMLKDAKISLDVLKGPLSEMTAELTTWFLAGRDDSDGTGPGCFTPASFLLFFNCFNTRDPFIVAHDIWSSMWTERNIDFRPFPLVPKLAQAKSGSVYFRLSDLEPMKLVMDFVDDLCLGLPPKGLLMVWDPASERSAEGLRWVVEDDGLRALLLTEMEAMVSAGVLAHAHTHAHAHGHHTVSSHGRKLAHYSVAVQSLLDRRDPGFMNALASATRRSCRPHIGRR